MFYLSAGKLQFEKQKDAHKHNEETGSFFYYCLEIAILISPEGIGNFQNFGVKKGMPQVGVANSWEVFSPDVGDSRH